MFKPEIEKYVKFRFFNVYVKSILLYRYEPLAVNTERNRRSRFLLHCYRSDKQALSNFVLQQLATLHYSLTSVVYQNNRNGHLNRFRETTNHNEGRE